MALAEGPRAAIIGTIQKLFILHLLHCSLSHTKQPSHTCIYRRLATYAITSVATIHLVFYADYQIPNERMKKHCFTDLQQAYRNFIDQNVWGIQQQHTQQQQQQHVLPTRSDAESTK